MIIKSALGKMNFMRCFGSNVMKKDVENYRGKFQQFNTFYVHKPQQINQLLFNNHSSLLYRSQMSKRIYSSDNIDGNKLLSQLTPEEKQLFIKKLEMDISNEELRRKKNEEEMLKYSQDNKLRNIFIILIMALIIIVLVPLLGSFIYGVSVSRRPVVKGTVISVDEEKFVYRYNIEQVVIESMEYHDKSKPVKEGDRVKVFVHPQNIILSVVHPKTLQYPFGPEEGIIIHNPVVQSHIEQDA